MMKNLKILRKVEITNKLYLLLQVIGTGKQFF